MSYLRESNEIVATVQVFDESTVQEFFNLLPQLEVKCQANVEKNKATLRLPCLGIDEQSVAMILPAVQIPSGSSARLEQLGMEVDTDQAGCDISFQTSDFRLSLASMPDWPETLPSKGRLSERATVPRDEPKR